VVPEISCVVALIFNDLRQFRAGKANYPPKMSVG
jgi:hypothetical protein